MPSSRLMLLIAVTAGILATILAFTYINSATGKQEPEPTASVLFVSDDLPANHMLDPDSDVQSDKIGTLSSPGLIRAAVKADEREAIRGRRINGPLAAGSPLLYSHLTVIEDIKLAPGTRAMSISVGAESMLGGMLVPGDHVDIIVSHRAEPQALGDDAPDFDVSDPQAAIGAAFAQAFSQSTHPDRWEAREVLADVRVIAIGDQLNRSRQQLLYGLGGGEDSGVVTIEVTTDQALELIRSMGGGRNPLTLLLRPPQATKGGQSIAKEGSLEQEGS